MTNPHAHMLDARFNIGILGFIYSFYEFLFIVIHYIIQLLIIPQIVIVVVIGDCTCNFFCKHKGLCSVRPIQSK